MLHLSGRTERDLRDRYDGRALTAAELLEVRSAPSVAAVVRAVATDEPQSGPGYFALAAVWVRLVGADLAAVRLLSAAASVLALPCAYALAFRLVGSRDVALAAAALVALSPLHLRYAAEARPYGLWSLALVAWALAAVRARDRGSRARWIVYGLALAGALSIHPLTVLVLPAVAAFALAPESGGRDRRFWTASAAAIATWAMWAAVGVGGRATVERTTAWSSEPIGAVALVRGWIGVLTSVFYRPGGEGGLLGSAAPPLPWAALGVAAVGLVLAALLGLGRRAAPVRRGVRRLALLPWAALAAADLVLGGRRSTVGRYLVPSWIGLELAVACLLTGSRRRALALAAVLALGAGTALRMRAAAGWWDTDVPRLQALAAAVADLAAVANPVVVTDAPPPALVELAYRLPAATALRLGSAAPAAIAEPDWQRVVLLAPSTPLLDDARRAAGPSRALVALGASGLAWRVVGREGR